MPYIDHNVVLFLLELTYLEEFNGSVATGQPVWNPKFLSQINKKLNILK